MMSETPEEFWYQNLAKYYQPPEHDISFPSNVVLTSLVKIKQSEICIFKGYLKNGDHMVLTYPRNGQLDGTIVVRNFIGMGVGNCEYKSETNVVVYNLDYNKPMTDDFFIDLLENSYGWEIKDYGDLSIY